MIGTAAARLPLPGSLVADEKITLTDYAERRAGAIVGATVEEASSFLPLPVWATSGKGFALKITAGGITVVTPKKPHLQDAEGVPSNLGAFVDTLDLGLSSAGDYLLFDNLKEARDIIGLPDAIRISSNDTGSIISIEFVAGVLDP